MNTVISNPAIGLAERPFDVRFFQPGSEGRSEVEQFIGDVFREAYGARISRFKPCLMSLRDHDNRLVAACGFRSAGLEPLFLENYLVKPIEMLLSERTGSPVKRDDIIEVGNFSVAKPGAARYLITAIVDQLHATSKEWAVFTAVPLVRNAFIKMGLSPLILGNADKHRLPPQEQAEWGGYYEQNPQIMAVRRIERRSHQRTMIGNAADNSQCKCRTCT